jgi:hypothetical protein
LGPQTDLPFGLVRVSYLGWPSRWDEWINADSYRLVPHNFQSMGVAVQDARQIDREFCAFLSAHMTLHEIDKDGNCLFRAVAHQVCGRDEAIESTCNIEGFNHHALFTTCNDIFRFEYQTCLKKSLPTLSEHPLFTHLLQATNVDVCYLLICSEHLFLTPIGCLLISYEHLFLTPFGCLLICHEHLCLMPVADPSAMDAYV